MQIKLAIYHRVAAFGQHVETWIAVHAYAATASCGLSLHTDYDELDCEQMLSIPATQLWGALTTCGNNAGTE